MLPPSQKTWRSAPPIGERLQRTRPSSVSSTSTSRNGRGRTMFLLQAPQVRNTEVFTTMPERFRRTGVSSEWAAANRGGQPADSFLEGPVFDGAGNLYVSDIPFGRIFRIDPKGEWDQVA